MERFILMADIPFEHAGCNGWAIYDSTNIVAENSKNMHIAEVAIKNNNGKVSVYLNDDDETICGEKLISVDDGRQNYYCSKSASDIRSKVAELQNDGHEICGTCVSHFHVDGEE